MYLYVDTCIFIVKNLGVLLVDSIITLNSSNQIMIPKMLIVLNHY